MWQYFIIRSFLHIRFLLNFAGIFIIFISTHPWSPTPFLRSITRVTWIIYVFVYKLLINFFFSPFRCLLEVFTHKLRVISGYSRTWNRRRVFGNNDVFALFAFFLLFRSTRRTNYFCVILWLNFRAPVNQVTMNVVQVSIRRIIVGTAKGERIDGLVPDFVSFIFDFHYFLYFFFFYKVDKIAVFISNL